MVIMMEIAIRSLVGVGDNNDKDDGDDDDGSDGDRR